MDGMAETGRGLQRKERKPKNKTLLRGRDWGYPIIPRKKRKISEGRGHGCQWCKLLG